MTESSIERARAILDALPDPGPEPPLAERWHPSYTKSTPWRTELPGRVER